MKKNKNLLNIVFGSILSLVVIAACSVADDEKPKTPVVPPNAPIGINAEFVQHVVGQEAVVEADKDIYAVFNESGNVTISSTGEMFSSVSASTADTTTYKTTVGSNEVTLLVNLTMVSGNATGASFERKVEGVSDGAAITTKFLDTIIDEGFVFMAGKTVSRTDVVAVQGTMSSDGKIFYPSANYGAEEDLPANFVYYTLDTGVYLFEHSDPDGQKDFPVSITVDPSVGLGTLKVNTMTLYNVKFDNTDPVVPVEINAEFVQNVKDQEAVVEADKEIYATFNASGDVTVVGTGETFTEVSASTANATTYKKTISGSEVTLVVDVTMTSGNATGANFQLEVNGVADGTTVTTKFLEVIIDEGLAFMSGKTLDRTDIDNAVQGNLSVNGEIFYPSANYGFKSGKPNNFVSYDLTTGIFLYQYTDEDPNMNFPTRITVDPATALGTLKVDASNLQTVIFKTTP